MKIHRPIKHHKTYYYLIPIILIFLAFMILRLFAPPAFDKTVLSIRFTEAYDKFPTTEIADFSQSENWKGDFTRDTMRTFEGETGLNLFSTNGKKAVITLNKSLSIPQNDTFFLYVFAANQEMVNRIQKLSLVFLTDNNSTQYDIKNLTSGWNLITIPKNSFSPAGGNDFSWNSVKAVSLSLEGKNDSFTQLTFNRIWSQKNLTYASLASYSKNYTSLKTMARRTYLHLASPTSINTVFDKKVTARNFMYTTSFAPLTFGTFALSFLQDKASGDGYRFLLEEERMDHWKLVAIKHGKEVLLQQGKLRINTTEKEAYMWLRVKKIGSQITLFSSVNGNSFEQIGEVQDTRFSSGFMGIHSKGSYLVDSILINE